VESVGAISVLSGSDVCAFESLMALIGAEGPFPVTRPMDEGLLTESSYHGGGQETLPINSAAKQSLVNAF